MSPVPFFGVPARTGLPRDLSIGSTILYQSSDPAGAFFFESIRQVGTRLLLTGWAPAGHPGTFGHCKLLSLSVPFETSFPLQ